MGEVGERAERILRPESGGDEGRVGDEGGVGGHVFLSSLFFSLE